MLAWLVSKLFTGATTDIHTIFVAAKYNSPKRAKYIFFLPNSTFYQPAWSLWGARLKWLLGESHILALQQWREFSGQEVMCFYCLCSWPGKHSTMISMAGLQEESIAFNKDHNLKFAKDHMVQPQGWKKCGLVRPKNFSEKTHQHQGAKNKTTKCVHIQCYTANNKCQCGIQGM